MPLVPKSDAGTRVRLFEHAGTSCGTKSGTQFRNRFTLENACLAVDLRQDQRRQRLLFEESKKGQIHKKRETKEPHRNRKGQRKLTFVPDIHRPITSDCLKEQHNSHIHLAPLPFSPDNESFWGAYFNKKRCLCALWRVGAGAAVRCRCDVRFGAWVLAVCALEPGCWCHCRVLLPDV